MKNIFTHEHSVTRQEREHRNRHKGVTVWLTGLSGSGKSTIADALEQKLFKRGHATLILDGDNIRSGLNSDLGFSKSDRAENIRRISEVAKLLTENGMIAITAFISPFRAEREKARRLIGKRDFIEVFLDCDLKTCAKRDPKGLYRKASKGRIKGFTGIASPYEAPKHPEITIDTKAMSIENSANFILRYLSKKGYLK